ncbi:hypothetical protein Clacol_006969 [Clathrus columnatus]|uniref:Uncharacterized protein n=1 Tax=Clathrus columnatus TaxID=1419009 RepID=A0AAV5AIQ7_9AGAM|nr:hypothetical protein Clacol_006969 [Clathrus columnatus]
MPSEYTTPVIDYISLATEQTQQYRDQHQQQQQQQQQQQHQASPSTISMIVPMSLSSIPVLPTSPLHSNLSLGAVAQSQSPLPPQPQSQTTQTKMCPVCHCALIPESSDIVNVQGVPNIACTACIASELSLRQQHHRRQLEDLEESLMNHSVSDATAPLPAQAHSSPPLPQRLSAIPTPTLSLSPLQNWTPSLLSINTPTQPTAFESQHVTPSRPVGESNGDKDKEKDDERRDSMMMMLMNQDNETCNNYCQNESENDGGNVMILDDDDDEQVVRDSLGLGLGLGHPRSHNATELDSASVSALDLGSGSAATSEELGHSFQLSSSQLESSQPQHLPSELSQPRHSSLTRALFVSSASATPQAPTEAETPIATVTATEPIAHVTPSSSPFNPPSSLPIMSSKPQPVLSYSKTKSHHKFLDPDPLTDISRLRARCHTHDCLYPGAQFCGTQKSGRSSYDVSVTIVDVDFQSSFLCGYLRIRGLTDDWPELTTYFDAQIIGSRYGFLTQDWGATETEDSTHWSRFPAYERIKPLMWGPKMNIPDGAGLSPVESEPSSVPGTSQPPPAYVPGEGGCVFMRWKERFLVPDHRVRDINGASFAGFYYVCVEFNPARSNASLKRRRRKVDKRTSGDPAMRDANVATVRAEETQQTRDQLNSLSILNPNLNANAKPPDTDVEMDELDNRGREPRERIFEGMDIEMDIDTNTAMDRFREVRTTPPSRSRSLIRGTTVHANQSHSHSRSRTRRRRRREEQQYDRYRMAAMQNAALGNNTATPVAVAMTLSNPVSSRPTSTSRRDDVASYSQSLPLPTPVAMMNTADDNCDDSSLSYREWERIIVRERERERGREREYSRDNGRERERGREAERQSRSGTRDVRPSQPPLSTLSAPTYPGISSQQQNSVATPSQTVVQVQTHTRTVVEPESEDSESDYEYEYEYDESVYSDDPAFDDTLGSTPGGPYTATMSGYYFHQHSEP